MYLSLEGGEAVGANETPTYPEIGRNRQVFLECHDYSKIY